MGLLTVVPALLPVGCGASDAVRESVDPVAEAADRTVARGGARIVGRAVYDLGDGRTAVGTMSGTVDFTDQRSRVRIDIPALSRDDAYQAGFPHEQIRDKARLYISSARLRARTGEAWGMLDAGRLLDEAEEESGADLDAEALVAWDESNPRDLLRFLEAAGGAKPAGKGRVDGVPVTRYAATVDLRRYAELVVPDDDEEELRAGLLTGLRQSLGADRIPIEVGIDRDGVLRYERIVLHFEDDGQPIETRLKIRFTDFGPHHDVELPEEHHVADMTDRADEFRQEMLGE